MGVFVPRCFRARARARGPCPIVFVLRHFRAPARF